MPKRVATKLPQTLFYLHGLDSSERSAKALQCEHYLQAEPQLDLQRPRLSYAPQSNHRQISAMLSNCAAPLGLFGSSMGGYYAAWAAQKFALPAVLINPVVRPEQLLPGFLGERINPHTGERYHYTQADLSYLEREPIQLSRPELLQVWLGSEDEVLDYRQAAAFYADCELHIIPGDNHALVNFEQSLPEMLAFIRSHSS